MTEARQLIDHFGLEKHPEGGWYRETWRAATSGENGRASGTAILFLLEAGQKSHWHKIDATEIWLWHAGAPLHLMTAPTDNGSISAICLGGDVLAGQAPQHIIAPHHWQAAEVDVKDELAAAARWTLVSCIVSPGFDFAGFTLASPDWSPANRGGTD